MSRYKNTTTNKSRENFLRKNSVGKFNTTIYDGVPQSNSDIFIITTEGDRLDSLAKQFYNDPNLWWYIAQTNNISTMNLEPGTSLRISRTTRYATGR
jgi:nucleoid-associated protein YgaU